MEYTKVKNINTIKKNKKMIIIILIIIINKAKITKNDENKEKM